MSLHAPPFGLCCAPNPSATPSHPTTHHTHRSCCAARVELAHGRLERARAGLGGGVVRTAWLASVDQAGWESRAKAWAAVFSELVKVQSSVRNWVVGLESELEPLSRVVEPGPYTEEVRIRVGAHSRRLEVLLTDCATIGEPLALPVRMFLAALMDRAHSAIEFLYSRLSDQPGFTEVIDASLALDDPLHVGYQFLGVGSGRQIRLLRPFNTGRSEGACKLPEYRHPQYSSTGVGVFMCQHGHVLGTYNLRKGETLEDVAAALVAFFPRMPKRIIYDRACMLEAYCLSRYPELFKDTCFVIDAFHGASHKCVVAVQRSVPAQGLFAIRRPRPRRSHCLHHRCSRFTSSRLKEERSNDSLLESFNGYARGLAVSSRNMSMELKMLSLMCLIIAWNTMQARRSWPTLHNLHPHQSAPSRVRVMPLLGRGSWAQVHAAEGGELDADGAGMDIDEDEGDCSGSPLPSDDDGGDSDDERDWVDSDAEVYESDIDSPLRWFATVAGQVGDDERGSGGLNAAHGADVDDGGEVSRTADDVPLGAVGTASAVAAGRRLPPAERRDGIGPRRGRPLGASPVRSSALLAARRVAPASIPPGRAGGAVASGRQLRARRQIKRRVPVHPDDRADDPEVEAGCAGESTETGDGVLSEGSSLPKRRRRPQPQRPKK